MDSGHPRRHETQAPDENLGALAVAFRFEDLREIDESASKIEVQGARYPETLERLTGR
jgi:hypothetical protein